MLSHSLCALRTHVTKLVQLRGVAGDILVTEFDAVQAADAWFHSITPEILNFLEGNQRQSCSDLEAELDSQAVAVASWSLSMWAADFSDASTWKQSQMSLVPWVEGDSPKPGGLAACIQCLGLKSFCVKNPVMVRALNVAEGWWRNTNLLFKSLDGPEGLTSTERAQVVKVLDVEVLNWSQASGGDH